MMAVVQYGDKSFTLLYFHFLSTTDYNKKLTKKQNCCKYIDNSGRIPAHLLQVIQLQTWDFQI